MAQPVAIVPVGSAPPIGDIGFSATQVINQMGRSPEAWESTLASAHVMKVPVAELAGYVVSRIGTPKASTRRTVQIPVRATHMDTLMPQDFMLEIEFRGGGGHAPAVGARRAPGTDSGGGNVPMQWFVGMVALFVVALAAVVVGFTALS